MLLRSNPSWYRMRLSPTSHKPPWASNSQFQWEFSEFGREHGSAALTPQNPEIITANVSIALCKSLRNQPKVTGG